MQLWDAIRAAVKESGKSMYAASLDMGRSKQYLSSYANANRNAGVEVIAEVCEACDSDLIIRNIATGKEFVITPSSADDSSNDEHKTIVAHVTFTKELDVVPKTCHECPFAELCDGTIAHLTKSGGFEWSKLAMTKKPKNCPMVIDS